MATLPHHNKILTSARKQRTNNSPKIDPLCPEGPYLAARDVKCHEETSKCGLNAEELNDVGCATYLGEQFNMK